MDKLNTGVSLDRTGLRKLGTALLVLRQSVVEDATARLRAPTSRPQSSMPPDAELSDRKEHQSDAVDEVKFYLNEQLALDQAKLQSLEHQLDRIGGPCRDVDVHYLGVASFVFDWWHLYENKVLIPYVKPRLPGWNNVLPLEKTFDGQRPIVNWHFWGAALAALERMFLELADYVDREGKPRRRPLISEDEKIFALLVSDLVNPPEPQTRGRKQAQSPNKHHFDNLERIFWPLAESGSSKNGAMKQAFEQLGLEIVSHQELADPKTQFVSGSGPKTALDAAVAEMRRRNPKRWSRLT